MSKSEKFLTLPLTFAWFWFTWQELFCLFPWVFDATGGLCLFAHLELTRYFLRLQRKWNAITAKKAELYMRRMARYYDFDTLDGRQPLNSVESARKISADDACWTGGYGAKEDPGFGRRRNDHRHRSKDCGTGRSGTAGRAGYLGCSAVFGSATKLNTRPMSKNTLWDISRAVTIPVVAIGGINHYNILALQNTGI